MELERFKSILEAYGTLASNWPGEERSEAESLVATSSEARSLLARYQPLDAALDQFDVSPDTSRLRTGILARVEASQSRQQPQGWLDSIVAWLLPEPGNIVDFWRPALVATVPLILGMVLGSQISFNTTDTSQNWDEEISLVALADTDSESLP